MDAKSTGAWLIHHSNKLQGVTAQPQYADISFAGNLGKLMSAITGSDNRTLNLTQVEALAANIGIDKFHLPTYLDCLKRNQLIDTSSEQIRTIGLTSSSVLVHSANIFNSFSPSPNELASIELAEITSKSPIMGNELKEYIGDTYKLAKDDVQATFTDSEKIGFVDYEKFDTNQNIYYNGNVFKRDNVTKVHRILESLGSQEASLVNQVNLKLKAKGCLSVEYVKNILGETLFNKITSVGLYDISVVSHINSSTGFVTLPSAFTKYTDPLVDDAFDLAKAFVSSITYGMTKSYWERGQIVNVKALIQALVNGRTIGPVRAIGQDYRVLEYYGVVEVRQGTVNGYYGPRTGPMMKLLKKEVGELALLVLTEGSASEGALTAFNGANVSSYTGPEANRVQLKRTVELNPRIRVGLLDAIRTGGLK
ncbi:hypothetical protein [Shewanella algae]|uniref:hypothetical protein n=1 Tax=Shewanella algae TaxID=38313 RepID=UPI001186F427|nr:hypothetical protein [Shewanella algae]TVP01867.1 hypothetical protein AYI73_20040 [Shewanella algae]BCV39985.1 hypothetical protein TUM17378_12470 [Shewanella algae]